MKKPIKLSPSSLNLMQDCPRCFWLQIVKGIRRPGGPFPSLPSGMDKILKEHFDRFMEKSQLPPELTSQECIKGKCRLFNDKDKLKIWRSNFKGLQYVDKKSGIMLRGAVDNILVKGKKLIVLDYKTRGFPLKQDTHEHYRLQMNLYNFLLRKNKYKTENFAYLLFYYPKEVMPTGEVIFNTDLITMKTNLKAAERAFKKAIKMVKGPMPRPSKECVFCEWVGKNK